jgi:hypothetical protein
MWFHSTSVLSRTSHNSEFQHYFYIFFGAACTSKDSHTNKLPKYRQLSAELRTFQAMKLGYISPFASDFDNFGSSLFHSSNSGIQHRVFYSSFINVFLSKGTAL